MQIIYADEIMSEWRRSGGVAYEEGRAKVQAAATDGHPTYLGIVLGVTYHPSTDRYVVKTENSTMKCTADVAEFLLTEALRPTTGARPTVTAHLTKGEVDSVQLLFLSRDLRKE